MNPSSIAVMFGSLMTLAAPLLALSCNESTVEFADHGDGTVTHSRTGLMWKRCVEGATWKAGTCIGSISAVAWSGALLAARNDNSAGYNDWRLPNVKELESIAEEKCSFPSINISIFPSTSTTEFWSSSTRTTSPSSALLISFAFGSTSYSDKSNAHQVRLVRAGQSLGSFDAMHIGAPVCTLSAAPTSVRNNSTTRLIASCNSLVTSYNWTGGACVGTNAPICDVTPSATNTYTVTGINNYGPGAPASITIKKTDLTPILMLLLD